MSNKIAEGEKSVSSVEEAMLIKISTVEDSIANITEQIKSEVKQFMKIQPCISEQIAKQAVPLVKTENNKVNKVSEKVILLVLGAVQVKAPIFDESTHWTMYLQQFEVFVYGNNWTKKKKAISLVLALKGSATELLEKVPPDSQNTCAELIKALELRYGDTALN